MECVQRLWSCVQYTQASGNGGDVGNKVNTYDAFI
nr:MAG TPA: Origin recognition complex subunit 1 [Caudoviricetes sp.]